MEDPSGIEPSLFEYVTEYCDKLESDGNLASEPLDKDNELIFFVENFLAQFSKSHLRQRITGLNERSEKQLVAERRKLEGRSNTEKAQLLMFHIEKLCSTVGEISYSNSEADAEEFHLYYFPDLLERIVAWLDEISAPAKVCLIASSASERYDLAIGRGQA